MAKAKKTAPAKKAAPVKKTATKKAAPVRKTVSQEKGRKPDQSLEEWHSDAAKRGNVIIHTGRFPIEVSGK